jgi:tetratricopeptide (TPR) repeat protein
MPFVAAKCPQCGGEIQLDSQMETGFCMHCGSKILVQEAIRAVRIDNTHMISTWMNMGKSALMAGNYEESYGYFTKVVENDPENWIAILEKGFLAALLSTFEKPRYAELIQAINECEEILQSVNSSQEEFHLARKAYSHCICRSLSNYYECILNVIPRGYSLTFDDTEVVNRIKHEEENCYNLLEYGLKLIDNEEYEDDEEAVNLIIEIKKEIVDFCIQRCGRWKIYGSDGFSRNWGDSLSSKKKYIDRYVELMIEIRQYEPAYRSGEGRINKTTGAWEPHMIIDLLDPSDNTTDVFEADEKLSAEIDLRTGFKRDEDEN